MSAAHEALLHYLSMGWRLVPVPHRTKAPVDIGWDKLEVDVFNLEDVFPLGTLFNVGVRMGAASRWLVDVDLDTPEAVELAPMALCPTWTFGRASRERSHWLYIVPEGIETQRFLGPEVVDADGKKKRPTLLEVRAGEGRAIQTVFPPSTHPSGEAIRWSDDSDGTDSPRIVSAESLRHAVRRLAVATLYARAGKKAEALAWLDRKTPGPRPAVPVDVAAAITRIEGGARQVVVPKSVRAANGATALDDAVRAYNQQHQRPLPRSGGDCPMCGHRNCFGTLPGTTERWCCFSTSHAGGGVASETCHTGDMLDIDAHSEGLSRVELLRRQGFLK